MRNLRQVGVSAAQNNADPAPPHVEAAFHLPLQPGTNVAILDALAHVIDDLVMFSAACAASGQVDQADIRSLATMRGIIPSPALSGMLSSKT